MNVLKIILIWLFIITGLIANQKAVNIAISKDMIPYSFVDDNGEPNGIFVDYWKLWSKKTGVKVQFQAYSWNESLEAIQESKADIHSGLFKNEQRKEFVKYLDKIYPSQSYVYVNKNRSNIDSIKDVSNQTVAVQAGAYFESYFKKNYPNIKIKNYKTFSQRYDSVKKGEADFFIDDSLIAWFQLIKDVSFSKFSTIKDLEFTKWFYAGIRKNDKELELLVLNGMKEITSDDIISIERKWIVDESYRYFEKKKSLDELTYEERLWLLKNRDVSLAVVKKWQRYSFLNSLGELKGFHLDLIEVINENLNTSIKYKAYDSWSEAFNSTKEGKSGGILGLSWSKEREEFFTYSPAYHYSPYHIIARKNDNSIKSLDDFNTKTAVTYQNSITNKIILNTASETKIIHASSIDEILSKIAKNEADTAIIENAKIANLDKYGLKIVDSVFTKYGEMSIGTFKGYDIFSSIIKKGIESISEAQMEELKDKWFNQNVIFTKKELQYIQKSPVLKVGIEDWTAIMGMRDGKNIEGLGAELVQKAFEISGLKFEFIKGNWTSLLQAFKDGEIDILPTTIYTKQRAEYGEFSDKYLSIKNYIYVKSNNNQVKSLYDLIGKKIAIQKDFATVTLIKEKFPGISVIETENLEDSIQRVLNDEVDALFELQISVENKMREFLITNLKSVNQNSIKSQGLHLFSKQGDILLQTILNKSMEAIPNNQRNKIISKWLSTFDVKKEVNVAFGLGRDPYILDKDYIKGIEFDLVNKILNMSSIKIKDDKNILQEELDDVLMKDDELDIAVNVVKDKHDGLYYSDLFLSFENIVVSRKSDDFKIEKISDLKDKKIIAFKNAYMFLGDEYSELFSPNNRDKNYEEYSNQEKQVSDFLQEKVDLVILDKSIFKWFFYKLGYEKLENYNLHFIFPKKNPRYVAFKDKNLRDIFNKNLGLIKESNTYDEIFNDYTLGYIEPKVKINSLISSLVAKYIFTDEIEQLKRIVDVFENLSFIEKIEVFDTQDEILYSTSDVKLKKFTFNDSYHFIVNVPQKVGYIKVYYDNKLLKAYENSTGFIPRISNFEDLNSFEFIKQVYKKFGYEEEGIDFTKKEKAFMNKKRVIRFSEINWEPLSIVDKGKFSGLFKDYIDILEKKTNLEFRFVELKSWQDVIDKFNKNQIDIIPGLGESAFTFRNGLVTNPFTSFKFAIVTNQEESFLDGLKDLRNKTLALPKNYSSTVLMKKIFPDIKIIETQGVQEALTLVSKSKADAFVGHSAIAVYNVKENFPDLKIAGLSDERFNHYFLVQDELPELQTIINKVIFDISTKEKQDIKNKWIKTEVTTEVDYSIIYKIIAIFSIVLIIVLIFTRKLSQAKKEIEKANRKMQETVNTLVLTKEELIEKTKDLEEQKNVFEILFNDTTDGLSLIKDGEFIACNNAVLKMLNINTKEQFLNTKPYELSPKLQPCGEDSQEKSKKMIDICLEKGTNRFEWLHKKSTGEDFWVELVLTKIVLNHEEVIHVVWRDIADKKALEVQNEKRNFQLEKANEELELSIRNLQQTQEQLIESEKMASLGGLVAGVAHEINTPIGIGLTGASHFIEITKDIKKAYENDLMTQEDFEDYLDSSKELSILINSNLKRAANLVKSFKQVAVDQTSEERRAFNMKGYITEILSSIHSVTKKTNLDIKVQCDKDIRINSFPGAISQIITNLIMNSIIHAYDENEKGSINIIVKNENNNFELIYTDDGRGIPEENLTKVFDPFFTTNRENGGSGLGLNIIYNIVTNKLNGTIKCKNNTKGVEFIIKFKV